MESRTAAVEPADVSREHARRPLSLVVVGTGIMWAGQTTLAASKAIARADKVLFGVSDAYAAAWIRSLNSSAESFRYPGDGRARTVIYRDMVETILSHVRSGARVCTVFYGSPAVLTQAAHGAVRQARAEGFRARMLPGVSFLDCLFCDLGVDPGAGGLLLLEATDLLLRARALDAHAHLVIAQIALIGNPATFETSDATRVRAGLSLLRERLSLHYPADHQVVLYEAAAHPGAAYRATPLSLAALAQAEASPLTTLYVPPTAPAPSEREAWARLSELRDSTSQHQAQSAPK